ncbi:MAG: hypothetical protein CMJ42_22835 [Phyllobacteriaceae bacterium]|nr:hypothetical protein [Phyllobacteriaceae bacterium]MBA89198.1 hypothetical protein [Phyllobacteriaceae bacterium]|tara:strand:- start:28 stop:294 length:267 start_codon:yes stop_codon:yes gene_type:complete
MTEDADTIVDQEIVKFYRRARATRKLVDAIWNQQEGVSSEGFQDRVLAAEALIAVLKTTVFRPMDESSAEALAADLKDIIERRAPWPR